ncbi:MAG: hypothetical protein KGL39_01465 [Patescibacteria group bacterium]|nr:hypothetical protein [Patescibacteria group bacterium]
MGNCATAPQLEGVPVARLKALKRDADRKKRAERAQNAKSQKERERMRREATNEWFEQFSATIKSDAGRYVETLRPQLLVGKQLVDLRVDVIIPDELKQKMTLVAGGPCTFLSVSHIETEMGDQLQRLLGYCLRCVDRIQKVGETPQGLTILGVAFQVNLREPTCC